MEVKYRIININVDEHSMLVRYYTDKNTEDLLASSFDNDNQIIRHADGYPLRCRTDTHMTIYNITSSKEEIEKHIQMNAPIDWFKLQEADKENVSALHDFKIGKENSFVHVPPVIIPTPEQSELSDEEIEKLLEQIIT